MKKYLLALLLSILSFLTFANDQEVKERIILYIKEANQMIKQGDLSTACDYAKIASDLADIKNLSPDFVLKVKETRQNICNGYQKQRDQYDKNYNKIYRQEQDKFCKVYMPILIDCASAGNIENCVNVRSNGVSSQTIRNNCSSWRSK